ncbi:hypothetical protein N7456_010464 [Penicillium angulare]|uniref:Copper transport protein n=1 Tax=Penicillium angulare TaxID=116970 RepID=A0A9W9K667_9EURO|nr:hypothetical protein N7456_010464 [Penicillium angulare]
MAMNMAMTAMTAMTSTASDAMPTGNSTASSTSKGSMGDMDMGGGTGEHACKMSMLWNWHTIDACFISRSWHITSRGMFAGSCIGALLLVIALEALRRLGREYDAFILRRARIRYLYLSGTSSSANTQKTKVQHIAAFTKEAQNKQPDPKDKPSPYDDVITPVTDVSPETSTPADIHAPGPSHASSETTDDSQKPEGRHFGPYRPSPVEQTVRALFHMVQFAVAYFIMLLAMYYNGYIIICIFLGAFIGSFIFSWEAVFMNTENDATTVTKCCG